MKKLIGILFAVLVLACQSPKKETTEYTVAYQGALHGIMKDGDLSAKAQLVDFKDQKHFYALGSVENLKGEIQVFNSQPYVTSVGKNTLHIDKTFTKKAAQLVYATVPEWETIKIPQEVRSYEQVEGFIKEMAVERGIDVSNPFPFLLEGQAAEFRWHVINWREGDTNHTYKKHKNTGMYGTMKNKQVTILGFYSTAHKEIITHHDTNMHMHIKLEGNGVGGHVDELTIERGMLLKIPKLN